MMQQLDEPMVDTARGTTPNVVVIDITDEERDALVGDLVAANQQTPPSISPHRPAGPSKQQMIESFRSLQRTKAQMSEAERVIDEIIDAEGPTSLRAAIARQS